MSLSYFDNVKISGMLSIVPERYINIDDELEYYDNNIKKLQRNKNILGLGIRHVVPDGVTALDLCEEAAKRLISQLNVDLSAIDTLIVTSINHDYTGNSDACIIQGNLGLSEECACFDTCGLGCTDAIYGLWLAHSLVQSGASKKCLFLEGSTSSLIVDPRNRHSSMLFGDAAAAIMLEWSESKNPAYFHLKSFGKDWKKIVTPAGGFRLPIREDIINIEVKDPEGNILHLWDSVMKGGAIFQFAMEQAPDSIGKILEFSKKEKNEIDFFAIHQANAQIVRTIVTRSQLPKEKTSSDTFTRFGNCGGTSAIINFCDQMHDKDVKDVLFVTFGVGLSVATCILNLHDTYNGGVSNFKTCVCASRDELIDGWVKYLESGNV